MTRSPRRTVKESENSSYEKMGVVTSLFLMQLISKKNRGFSEQDNTDQQSNIDA